jgi:hypothetical protein
MSYRSTVEFAGGSASEPDYIYYNADIINNKTDDITFAGLATPDPQIRFNETRDTALIRDSSKYHFSIVRFTMNGPNRDLPLFIPNIQTGQSNPNLTTYSVALSYQQSWNTNLGVISFALTPLPTFIQYAPETQNTVLAPIPRPPTTEQDLSSRYYWVYTYQHWLDLVNYTISQAHQTLYTQFQAAWAAYPGLTDPFPFSTLAAFKAYVQTPQITYDDETKPLFSFFMDSDGFGQRLTSFTPIPYAPGVAGQQTKPILRFFMNTNMYGLFANFSNLYWNSTTIPTITQAGITYPGFTSPVPEGYTNEILAVNKFYQNIIDYRIAPYTGAPPLGYVPVSQQKVYYKMTQDYKSVDSLWSPIASIVFTSTLLPIRYEQSGPPTLLGTGNLGESAPTARSAFQPIITDIALDTSLGGADDYRQFIYYAPNAEYRLADFSPSRQEIRNIDIQVYWKSRLSGELYPLEMFNLSSVSLKVMFRHKDAAPKSG